MEQKQKKKGVFTNNVLCDAIARIRNACLVKAPTADVVYSKLNEKVMNLMANRGYVKKVEKLEDKFLRVSLKYYKGESVIRGANPVSRPSRKVYVSNKNIPQTRDGIGMTILTTSKGILTKDEAEKEKVGGQVLLQIW
jgi:small subunit ribosomal protein S8